MSVTEACGRPHSGRNRCGYQGQLPRENECIPGNLGARKRANIDMLDGDDRDGGTLRTVSPPKAAGSGSCREREEMRNESKSIYEKTR